MIADRSLRTDVRNPLLKHPAMQTIIEYCRADRPIPPALLRQLLAEMSTDFRATADKAWAKHKAPMAVYWKGAGVYAGHTKRAMRPGPA